MTQEGFKRKLTSIFSADAVGYSRLMGEDEAATVRTLTSYRNVISDLIKQHNGTVIDSPGDNLLAEFASVVNAVQCAVAVQKELKARNEELPEGRKMRFRIGINLGDVIQEKCRIYGDGVNIAARLEGLADPGGICISKTAFDQIESKLPYRYDFIGNQTVKNISKPVGAYRVVMEPRVTVAGELEKEKSAFVRRWPIFVGVGAVIVLAVAVGVWQIYMRRTSVEPASVEKMAYPLPDRPSIAVLPFDNLSDDPDQEYFSDGITDDLITDLSKISDLFVMARNSTFSYKGKPVRIKQVAEELGVRYVLEGSTRKESNQIRINVQLIDALTGWHVWADRYDREYKDIFALQDEIIQQIVAALSVRLTGKDIDHLSQRPTENIEAYDYYLRGLQTLYSFTGGGLVKAKSEFKKAIDADPYFAGAYAAHAMADFYITRYLLPRAGIGSADAQRQAYEYVGKALAINSNQALAYSVLAGLQLFKRLYDEAAASAEKAVSLDPNSADRYAMLSYVLTIVGRHQEAMVEINKAFRLNPKPPDYYYFLLGYTHFNHGQYAKALESFKKVKSETKVFWFELTASYVYLDQFKEAKNLIEQVLKIMPNLTLYGLKSALLYKKESDNERLITPLRLLGVPELPYEYVIHDTAETLTGDKLKDLYIGRTTTGINPGTKCQWSSHYTEDGKVSTRGCWGNDYGSYWFEGNQICMEWEYLNFGRSFCCFIHRRAKGLRGKRSEYDAVCQTGVISFSVADEK